jgi:sec-independent protein translocase protein TatC
VLLLLLNRAGIVSRKQLAGMRRYVIVAITAVAAIITPPDVVSQLMLLVPMIILFEGSLVIMRLGERKAAKEAAAEPESELAPIEPAPPEPLA